jgi:hypothetical protein
MIEIMKTRIQETGAGIVRFIFSKFWQLASDMDKCKDGHPELQVAFAGRSESFEGYQVAHHGTRTERKV